MPAALMHRLCGLTSESSVAWTRRAALLAARQDPTPFRTFATKPYRLAPCSVTQAADPEAFASRQDYIPRHSSNVQEDSVASRRRQSQTPDNDVNYQRNTNTSRSAPFSHPVSDEDATLEMLKDGFQASLAKPRGRRHAPVKPKQRTRSPKKAPSIVDRLYRGTQEDRAEAWQDFKLARARYVQWGYLRHQSPPSSLVDARSKFNFWKRKMQNIMNPKNPSSWPWRDSGKWIFELDGVANMRQAWEELDAESRRERWPTVMLSTLHLCPDRAHLVLNATMDPLPPGYAMSDALLWIAQNLKLDKLKTMRERIAKGDEILEVLSNIIENVPVVHVPFSQRTFGLFAKKLLVDQTAELHQMLVRSGQKLHHHTLLHFGKKLAESLSHKEKAFEILKDLGDSGVDLNDAKYSSAITTLLHTKDESSGWSQTESTFSPQQTLQYFIEKGFSPNIINFTAMLDALCQQGEIEEAIRLPLLLAENGVELDTRAYATVFRGAKHSLKAENIRGALNVARAAKAPYVDVLNNALHSVFYFADMESREKRHPRPWVYPLFGPMLRLYAMKFELEPLQWLLPDSLPLLLSQDDNQATEKFDLGPKRHWDFNDSVVPVVDELFSSGEGPRLQPDSTTLAIMLRAYIKSLHRPYDLMSFYSFFKSRLEERGQEKNWARDLIREEGSVVHDTVILVMSERKVLLRPALQVFGDMVRDAIKAKATEGETDRDLETPPIHPAPSFFTFSILVHGLLLAGEKLLAEQVLRVMREEGVEPNLVTWNTLAKGYASMQNISRTVGTLQDLEAAGLKPDAHTFKAFGRLQDQTRALKMMESIIDVNKEKMAREQASW